MANYTIDKIAYGGNTYTLKDTTSGYLTADEKVKQAAAITTSGAFPIILGYSTATTEVTNTVNKASTLTYNPSTKSFVINSGEIRAKQGIFDKIVTTTATVNGTLTAQNATVIGLLDVQGQLKTNSWTNSNIATIEGNFFIAPTLSTGSTISSSTTKLTISKTGDIWEISIAGTFVVNQIGADPVDSSDTNLNQWSEGSVVLITGEVAKTDGMYPLGTLKGTIKTQPTMNSSGIASSISITNVTDNLGNTDILTTLGAGSYQYRNIKISLTQRKYGSDTRPIGILMSAQGRASKSFIDIYGGANKLEEGKLTRNEQQAQYDYGGLAVPNVRIGNLYGLPNIDSGDFTDNDNLPKGWGIYTDNGYFKGTVVANSGAIGGAIISEGVLTISDANIANINASKITARYLDAITADMGVLTAGRIQGGTPGQPGFMFIAPEDYNNGYYKVTADIEYNSLKTYYTLDNGVYTQFQGSTFNSGVVYYEYTPMGAVSINNTPESKKDWRLILGNKFGVDKDGKLYGSDVNLQGDITASTFKVVKNGVTYVETSENGIIIGDSRLFHLSATNSELGFYHGTTEVAYVNQSSLYITKSVVLNQMDVGYKNGDPIPSSTTGETGKGQWSWKIHLNASGQNNLYLKWIG